MGIDAFQRRQVGRTDLRVTQLGFGTATLGDIRVAVDEARASATIEAAWAAGVGFFDTAPWYGRTKSEHRLGAVLRNRPRDSYVLSTKIGRVFAALEEELALCVERGASVVIGAPFASGILALGPREGATYGYRPAEDEVLTRARRIDEICQRFGVPLGAAALQFPFGHPAVVSVIPGPNAPDQVRTNLAWMRHDVPPDLWAALKAERLIRPDAPTP
ncbi:MAG TPA: aldo/keto reductase [Chloroflexota bacterium]|jgi:aryl-alcohol dehydrogenase-like predicted oxidoreductase